MESKQWWGMNQGENNYKRGTLIAQEMIAHMKSNGIGEKKRKLNTPAKPKNEKTKYVSILD